MKSTPKFITELIITIVIAGILSGIAALLLAFITGNAGTFNESVATINAMSSVVFGLIIGYKLNSLLRQHTS
jgi:predicted membrane protein